jgi:hypothetical protein
MSKKPYFETHRIIKFENDPAGKKRVWVEVAEDEAIMLKVDGKLKDADINALAAAKLQELKDRRALEEEREALEAQLAEINAQLGEG